MRDLASNISPASSVAPAVHTATVTGSAVDLLGFDAAAVMVSTGAIAGAGDFTARIQHSDQSASGFVDVAADDLVGTLPATLLADRVVEQGYIGNRRFVRVVLTRNSGTSIAAGAVVVRGHPMHAPVA